MVLTFGCRFCDVPDGDGLLFWECPFSSPVHIRESPKFFFLMSQDLSNRSRCLLRHGWLPAPLLQLVGTPWDVAAANLACNNLENAVGACPLRPGDDWCPYWETADHLAALTHVFPWDQRKLFNVLNVGESSWLSRPSLAFTLALTNSISMVEFPW